jgi:hypothetical protein
MTVEYITKKCPRCGETETLRLDAAALEAWQGGMLIQKAFPELDADTRERMISGYCNPCWDIVFCGPARN